MKTIGKRSSFPKKSVHATHENYGSMKYLLLSTLMFPEQISRKYTHVQN